MSLIKNLKFSYTNSSQPLLNIDEWEIPDFGISSLKGPSGSGKSTLIRCLLGFNKLSFTWGFKGQNLNELPIKNRRLGVVFQKLHLFPNMTAKENIHFAGQSRKIKDYIHKTEILAKKLKISNHLNKKISSLSGGEAQRVALARAIVGEPIFLFLDEPFSSLDAEIKSDARDLVKNVISEYKIPALLISHDDADIEILSNHKFVLKSGKVIKY